MSNPMPAVTSLLSPDFKTGLFVALTKNDYDQAGNLVVDHDEASCSVRVNARWGNGVSKVLQDLSDYVRGLEPITGMQIAEYFRNPQYTTAQLTNALAAEQGAGSQAFNTTTSRLVVSNGTTWLSYLATGDVSNQFRIVEVDGDVDGSFDALFFENIFELENNGDDTASVVGLLQNSVALDRLTQGTARSVPCRAANSSGSLALVSGGGSAALPRIFSDDGTSLAFRELSLLSDAVLYDQDFSLLSNNTLADGAEVIGPHSWTCANAAAAAVFAIEAASGLHFDANATNSNWIPGTRTAASIRIPIATLIPSWDPMRTYLIDAYFSSLTLGSASNRVLIGLDNDGAGTDRLAGGGPRNTNISCQSDATTTGAITYGANTAFGIKLESNGVFVCAGTYSSGFPTAYTVAGASSQHTSPNAGHPVMDPTASLVIAFITGETGAAMDAVLRRLRVRRIA